jgi:soluble P-type ATPase
VASVIPLPGEAAIRLQHLVLDFTGTLAKDGRLLAGVGEPLRALSTLIHIAVISADTRRAARTELAGLPVDVHVVADGTEKASLVRQLGSAELAAIGNGRNDVAIVNLAAFGIAARGAEETAAELI